MIRAFVVEDERLIREGIASQVQWKNLKIDEIRTADNAETAIAVCADYRPDIIISDIRMPGMDGITMCTKLRTMLPDIQVIFISGFSDKEYLMSAIGLHAVNYIEKPISLEELETALRNAVASLQKTKNEKTNVLHSLISARTPDPAAVSVFMQTVPAGARMFCVLFKGRHDPDLTPEEIETQVELLMQKISRCGIPYMTDFSGEHRFAVMFYSADETSADRLYHDTLFWQSLVMQNGLFVGIGSVVATAEEVHVSFDDAYSALKCLSFRGWNSFAYSGQPHTEWTTPVPAETLADFKGALESRHERTAAGILESIRSKLVESDTLLTYNVRSIYYTLDDAVQKSFPQLEDENSIKEHAETIQELHEYLIGRVHEALSCGDTQKSTFIINKIIQYIHANYSSKALSVQSIADAVFLTPTYISCLFRKKTGKTISQYMQDYRLEKAQEFLRDPQYKIYQISDMVGYEDAHYFAKIFRRQTGLTPSDFRDQA